MEHELGVGLCPMDLRAVDEETEHVALANRLEVERLPLADDRRAEALAPEQGPLGEHLPATALEAEMAAAEDERRRASGEPDDGEPGTDVEIARA